MKIPMWKTIMVYVVVILAFDLVILGGKKCYNIIKERKELRSQVSRLQYTLAHSVVQIQRDTIRDSIPVASQPAIVIDKTDYKKLEADEQLIKDLKLRIDQVEAENRMLLATQGQVELKPAADSDSVLRYADRWCDFTYRVKPKKLAYTVRDSLTTFVSREYKHRFLWWRWGTKGYNIHTVNFNPHAVVVYNKYLKVEKRK